MYALCLIIYRKKKLTMIYWYQLEEEKNKQKTFYIYILWDVIQMRADK